MQTRLMAKNKRFQQKVHTLIEKDGVSLTPTESDEILSLMKEISTDSEVTKFLPIYTVKKENEAQHFEGQNCKSSGILS